MMKIELNKFIFVLFLNPILWLVLHLLLLLLLLLLLQPLLHFGLFDFSNSNSVVIGNERFFHESFLDIT